MGQVQVSPSGHGGRGLLASRGPRAPPQPRPVPHALRPGSCASCLQVPQTHASAADAGHRTAQLLENTRTESAARPAQRSVISGSLPILASSVWPSDWLSCVVFIGYAADCRPSGSVPASGGSQCHGFWVYVSASTLWWSESDFAFLFWMQAGCCSKVVTSHADYGEHKLSIFSRKRWPAACYKICIFCKISLLSTADCGQMTKVKCKLLYWSDRIVNFEHFAGWFASPALLAHA